MTEKIHRILTELQEEFDSAQKDGESVTTASAVTSASTMTTPPPVPLKPENQGGVTPVTPPVPLQPGGEGPSVIPNFSGHVTIGVNRFGYGETSTCSVFIMQAYDRDGNVIDTASGFFLEPGYDLERNTIAGSDTAIPSGSYPVIPAYHRGKSGYFEISDVSGRSAIHFHIGNTGADTEGCFLPGSNYSYNPVTNEYTVGNSTVAMNKFRSFINKYGSGYATIYVSM